MRRFRERLRPLHVVEHLRDTLIGGDIRAFRASKD